ncbi:MAG: HAMP domain-containing protein [Rhodospirillum sp.]|nr:HAMP domain-containing protein [Rhodospirillum sp.]
MRRRLRPLTSLRAKLGIGSGLLGAVAVLACMLAVVGVARVSQRVEAALEAERRVERYAVLSTQITTFMVISVEALQPGLDADARADRLSSLIQSIHGTYNTIHADIAGALTEAHRMGVDDLPRRETQGMTVTRMEALFNAAARALTSPSGPAPQRATVDGFSLAFDPLLNAAISEETRARETILRAIEDARGLLTATAGAGALAAVVLVVLFHGLVTGPLLRRVNLLRGASRDIGRGDFSVSLPGLEAGDDEVGQLFHETNRMAGALARREADVRAEWTRLNETIGERTEDLRRANEALSRADADRRRFFADISHELRTPLTVITMEAELGLGVGGEGEANFTTILNRARRLNRRIDDLLRVARSDSGQITLASLPFDLTTAAAEAVADARSRVAAAGMTLELAPAPEVPVIGDMNWTRQITADLIDNAVRHAREGQAIRVELEPGEDLGRLRVLDNGPGIADADRVAVFERFTQGRGKGRSEGYGIGLSLAQWVIEGQGGVIEVISPVPEDARLGHLPGTMVVLGLPTDSL